MYDILCSRSSVWFSNKDEQFAHKGLLLTRELQENPVDPERLAKEVSTRKLDKDVIVEVFGFARFEKRILELLRVEMDKREVKIRHEETMI